MGMGSDIYSVQVEIYLCPGFRFDDSLRDGPTAPGSLGRTGCVA